jgi:3'-phosphoadenosine 5'-phosphosulfate (PAPS) 3'-phosphatase
MDGTDAFIKGGPRGYAVQIARMIDGTVELAVVYEPAVDEMFLARRGVGAWVSRRGGPVEAVRVTGGQTAERFVCSTRTRPSVREVLESRGIVDVGAFRSVGVKVGLIAAGLAEVYPITHRVSYWDIAAPLLILEESGGRATYLDGQAPTFPLDPPWEMEGPMLLSCLPEARHLELCRALAAAGLAEGG